MLEHGSNNSLPAKYRIALALSTAFLIHTLLLSGIPVILQDADPVQHRQQLNLELVGAKNNRGSPPANAPKPVKKPTNRNPPFEATLENNHSQPAQPVISTSNDQQKTANTEDSQAAPAKTEAKADLQVSEKKSSKDITRITQSPSEQDPYLIKLAIHLASELETLRIPAIKKLTSSSIMELELQLLENGALTRVRVITSTGIEQIDSAAYRAALSASPYPEPPPDQNGKNRFEVKLVFAPERL